MIKWSILAAALGALLVAASLQAASAPKLERVVVVMRHGVRPPTQSNEELAKYAAEPWPAWPVAPGELTPHGAETVRLMGESLARVYRADGLLPAKGCPMAGGVSVWADGTDQRTRRTGEVLAASLAPGCQVKATWAAPQPRDPLFAGSDAGACHADPVAMQAAFAEADAKPDAQAPVGDALQRLQAILAPDACRGGKGTCFLNEPASGPKVAGMVGRYGATSGLAEDLLLEYADGKPMKEVGWGRAKAADIADVMRLHDHTFDLLRDNAYFTSRRGAPMARAILAYLSGAPVAGGPQVGPATRLLAFAGHDTNVALMGGLFGLKWRLPDEPDYTAPSTALVLELWRAGGTAYVRPVVYYETLDQLRTLKPGQARAMPLRFAACSSGPMSSCPLAEVKRRVEAKLIPGCGGM